MFQPGRRSPPLVEQAADERSTHCRLDGLRFALADHVDLKRLVAFENKIDIRSAQCADGLTDQLSSQFLKQPRWFGDLVHDAVTANPGHLSSPRLQIGVVTANSRSLVNANAERWLDNMKVDRQFSAAEIRLATGMSFEDAANEYRGQEKEGARKRSAGSVLILAAGMPAPDFSTARFEQSDPSDRRRSSYFFLSSTCLLQSLEFSLP